MQSWMPLLLYGTENPEELLYECILKTLLTLTNLPLINEEFLDINT